MRTTIFLDDELGQKFRATAKARGMSLSAFLAEAGRVALRESETAEKPFELITRNGRGLVAPVDLDRTGELLVAEDQESYRTAES